MYCISQKISQIIAVLIALSALISCSGGGIQSGSSAQSFSGVKTITITSPTSLKITWEKNDLAKEYQIFKNSSTQPIGTTALDYYVIENLTPESTYSFKVISTVDGQVYGADNEIQVTMWPRFTGITSAQADGQGNIELSWTYAYTPQKYLIYYRKTVAPDSNSTNSWATVSAESTVNKILISGLDSSSKYYFMVHAQYRDSEKEITTKSVSLTTQTSFSAPAYTISTVSIGNVPTLTIDPTEDTLHGENFFKTTVLWNGVAVSDPLIGKGQIILSASANLPLGKVDNISLKVEYADGNRSETMTIEGLTTYIKGIPTNIETPATSNLPLGASYLGKTLAKGDFNCDGMDDLAVGIPDISVGSIGVKTSSSGAVIVYYSKEVTPGNLQLNLSGTPVISPAEGDPQLIAFDDLVQDANFGFSLATGNFNGDKNGQYNCDELIVGSPWAPTIGNTRDGAVYMFFGSKKGLSTASHLSDIASNTATCDGSLSNAICSPVKLFEDPSKISTSLTAGTPLTKSANGLSYDQFGYSVSFIGDFNADGYDDIAVGAPNANYDGTVTNFSTGLGIIERTGSVIIFLGSKFGLGFEYPAATGVPTVIDPKAGYLKVYAPIPQSGARFGAAIAGGADIDGRYKIRANAGLNFYGGGDFVVGSPGFVYNDYTTGNNLALAPYSVGIDKDLSSILQGPGGGVWWNVGAVPLTNATSYYGFPQGNTAVGAAFVYFGRSSATISVADESPNRSQFWKCGKRGMFNGQHFSCLFDNSNVQMLTPRQSSTATSIRGFGSAVAVLGSKSRFKDNSGINILTAPPGGGNPKQYFSDTNEDGFADVVVSAPTTTVSGKTNVGALHVFYGNSSRLFNAANFYNLYSDLNPNSDTGSNVITCADFTTINATTTKACKPVIISSSSLAAGALIGSNQSQFAVGDVTGDGLMDLAVGAPGDNVIAAGSGAALIFTSVKNGGLSSAYKKIYTTSADLSDNFGSSVVIGNFNGDKNSDQSAKGNLVAPYIDFPYGDLFAGAPNDEIQRPAGGAVYGFYTQNTAMAATRSLHDVVITESLASFTDYGLGETRLVGDINNDGYADAVSKVTSYLQNGQKTSDAVIYYGSSMGLVTTSFCLANQSKIFTSGTHTADCYPSVTPNQGLTNNDIALPQKIVRPSNLDSRWSYMAMDAGDVNQDGFSDVLFIPPAGASITYSVLFFGSRTGLLSVVDPSWLAAVGDPQIVSQILTAQNLINQGSTSINSTNNRYPYVAADFNGDGYSDLAFGIPGQWSRSMNLTEVLDPLTNGTNPALGLGWECGAATGIWWSCAMGTGIQESGSIRVLYGSSYGYQTPRRNGSTGDIDRGEPYTMNMVGTEEAAEAFKPCESTTATSDPICKPTYMDNPVFENISYGYLKLGHTFGLSITSSDVNHDGYPDLLVAAPGFEDLGCYAASNPSNYGRIYVFYGSEFGVTATAARNYYTADLNSGCPATFAEDKALQTTNGGKVRAIMPTLVGNPGNRQFGFSLAGAGDVNGDGYEDFVVSDPNETINGITAVGANYIYYGPLCPADNYGQVADDFQHPDNLNIQRFYKGQVPVTAAANQVSNVTIADTSVTNTCFRGASSKMKPMPQKFYILSGNANEFWGQSLITGKKTKGDFNRDGYDDVIVGSPYYDDPITGKINIGQGIVFFGSSLGLYTNDYAAASVVVTSTGQLRPYSIVPGNYTSGSQFFIKMSASGDINGDGTMDILVPSVNYSGLSPFNGVDIGTFFIFN